MTRLELNEMLETLLKYLVCDLPVEMQIAVFAKLTELFDEDASEDRDLAIRYEEMQRREYDPVKGMNDVVQLIKNEDLKERSKAARLSDP